MTIEGRIKSAAMRLGFSLVGITSPDRPQTYNTYQQWIDAGKHASMGYLATDRNLQRRKDPQAILPGCKSIIVTGTNYLPHDPFASSAEAEARIAAYALGDDYHEVIAGRLGQLVSAVEGMVDERVRAKIYTDTGPILERDLAQRAGLGWIGKNTCLINPRRGSYFLLGEILIDLPLQPDEPFHADRCGSCTRCLDACPTRCILPDRTIDAGRCISYLTIEEKGTIEESLRADLGRWIFGCDICQQVCPWNRRYAQPSEDPAFQPRESLRIPDLGAFLDLKPGTWLQNLRGSPMERPRRKGLVRNAAVVAGNSGSSRFIAALVSLVQQDPEPLVRGHAAWALGQIKTPETEAALRAALQSETEPGVIGEIKNALSSGA
ncbi:MAG: tRNA epoxyqueuosine(34) reductase QueG [Anaerolineales bacterium]|jgi:epoxyqueuosine reductase